MPSRVGLSTSKNRAKEKKKVGPLVCGQPITGQESTQELLRKAFKAFVGREIETAYEIIRRMIAEDHTIVLSISGAMTPADLGSTCIVPLIRAGLVDLITTTGANIYHDMQRLIEGEFYAVDPNAGDLELRKAGLTRIYDLVFPEDDLYRTDQLVRELVQKPAFQRAMTTPEFHDLLGRYLTELERVRYRRAPKRSNSLTVQAHLHRVPIVCGAPQDGSIYLNVAYLKRVLGDRFRFSLDIAEDIHEFGAYHWLAKNRWSKKLSIIILGGGVPKNYSLQPEPYLGQICNIETEGYDCDVQFCDAHVQNGGLSSCSAGEAHTWGKVSAEYTVNSQYVFTEVTATFPFLVHALLQEGLHKRPRKLLDCREEAMSLLDTELKKR
jgi:deoxyhypusine synthase